MSAYTAAIDVALRVAKDLDACRDLLAGHAVDPERLDADGLEWAREQRWVQLARPIDQLPAGTGAVVPSVRSCSDRQEAA